MYIYNTNNMSVSLNFDTEQLSSMELYSLQLQKVIADFTEFDAVTKAYVDDKVSQAKRELTDGASTALDTFKELEDYLTVSGVAGGLVEQIAALSASIATEQTRAGSAEATLQASIDAESSRAQTKENQLQSEVDTTQVALGVDSEGKYQPSGTATHISGAISFKNADELLDVAIENERIARQAAGTALENSLESKIAVLSSQQSTDNTSLVDNLNSEILRATNREGELQADIDNEEARAKGIETSLSSSIAAETSRAQSAESTLQSNIEANSGLIINKHGEAIGAVDNEEHRARNAETALEDKIGEEKARAESAEFSLGTALGEEQTRALNAEADLASDIATERKRNDEHDGDIQALGERPHDAANGGFDIGHVEGSEENKYMYFSKRWRLFGSSSGDRLIFEYNKGTEQEPNWKSAVPFISHV
jgi:uncharacterized protein YlxW (UPF0749 family)